MDARSVFLGAILALLCLHSANSLYEDQIRKFDWRSLQIGALQHAHLALNSFQPRLLISSRANVIASVCPKTGELLWRQVLEKDARGDVKMLYVNSENSEASNTAEAHRYSNFGFDVLSVQGHAPAIVRGWNANTGNIEWEWSLMPLQTERAEAATWFYSNAILYHLLPVWKSHLEVTQYFATTGQANGLTSRITAPWINAENCLLSGTYYTCLEGNQLISFDVSAQQSKIYKKSLQTVPKHKLRALNGLNGVVIVDDTLSSVNDEIQVCSKLKGDTFLVGIYNQRKVILQAYVSHEVLQILAYYADTCEQVDELANKIDFPCHYGFPELQSFNCKNKRNNDGKGCLFILSTSDEAILAVQQNKLRWVREESLADIVATEFIDLPLADTEGALENEMKGKSGDIVSAFVRRVSAQIIQIKRIFLHVIGLGPPPTDTQKAGLVRDSFGLHKMLVVLTRSGKIFGIDNISGKHHWTQYLPRVENFANEQSMRLIVQRTSKHFPLQPLCAIVAKDTYSGNGVLYRFNPITGKPSDGGLLQLNYKIKQMALLAETENDFVKGVLLIAPDNNVHVYPETAKKMANGMYIFIADKSTATLNGLFVTYKNNELSTNSIWNVRLGGHNSEQEIIAVASKNPIERVHSQGRVLGDRSVLYKYINPNLVAVVTQAFDTIHKYVLNIYLVDVVSGSIVFSMSHRKVRGPVNIVHSENWLAYSYYNDKVRRSELTTIELYEGKIQANSTVWSSLNAPPMPLVERQSYIIPTIVETLRETITERGITSKHVLIGTASGAIVEMPWSLLDPRRPVATQGQGREEGVLPYIPELPLPTENIINYNQTISRLRNIFTAPSGLESTCLVVATGLDMFVTRVSPSKTFDLLKEDFDYILISVVLVALTTGSLVVKHLASRKLIKQAWK